MRSLSRVASLVLGAAAICGLGAACRQSSSEAATGIVDGFWEGACLDSGGTGSRRLQYLFQDGGSVERRETLFADAGCQEPFALVRFNGRYKILTTSEDLTYAIEMSLEALRALPMTAEGATRWRETSFCSRSDWEAGREFDIGLSQSEGCPSFGFLPIDYRDLVRIDDRPALLVFATDLNHAQPRPESIDLNRVAGRFTPAGH